MQRCTVHVRAPSRLHFGLFSFGNQGRQFGGVGVMVEQPSLCLQISDADQFVVDGQHDELLLQVAERWAKASGLDQPPNCRVSVVATPRRHVGLGSGTQLALSIAAGLTARQQRSRLSAAELARVTGRGSRSAVGTYGFVHGGLIVESGKLAGEELSPLDKHVPFPLDWRFVLVQTARCRGLYGKNERSAFDRLPPVSSELRDALVEEVYSRMLPALATEDCSEFGDSVYRFGHLAGSCFAPVQGGPYNGPRVTALVKEIRDLGVHGVGQSSWGPTLFCVVPDQHEAERLQSELRKRHMGEQLDVYISAANNCGAVITIEHD